MHWRAEGGGKGTLPLWTMGLDITRVVSITLLYIRHIAHPTLPPMLSMARNMLFVKVASPRNLQENTRNKPQHTSDNPETHNTETARVVAARAEHAPGSWMGGGRGGGGCRARGRGKTQPMTCPVDACYVRGTLFRHFFFSDRRRSSGQGLLNVGT